MLGGCPCSPVRFTRRRIILKKYFSSEIDRAKNVATWNPCMKWNRSTVCWSSHFSSATRSQYFWTWEHDILSTSGHGNAGLYCLNLLNVSVLWIETGRLCIGQVTSRVQHILSMPGHVNASLTVHLDTGRRIFTVGIPYMWVLCEVLIVTHVSDRLFWLQLQLFDCSLKLTNATIYHLVVFFSF